MTVSLFDTHCHLDDEKYNGDLTGVFARMRENHVDHCVCAGSDLASSLRGARLSEEYSQVYFAAGVHPHECGDVPSDYIQQLSSLLDRPKCVALGEIGLDYHYDFWPRETQKTVLREQLTLAHDLVMPVILHVREAHGDMLALLRGMEKRPRGIVHCFSGSAESAREYLSMGYYIAFGGALTFKNARNLLEAALAVPDDRILIETDSPYMTPEPHRGRVNEPGYVSLVCQRLALLRGVSYEEMANITSKNALRIYGLLPA